MKLLEVLAAAAIGAALAWVLVRATHTLVLGSAHLDAGLNASRSLDRLSERLESEAASSWSIFIPPTDALGAPNGDGHELDFETEDGAHNRLRSGYLFTAASASVTEYAYAGDAAPAPGDAFTNLTGFAAEAHPLADLDAPASAIYDPLLSGSGATSVAFDYGWGPAGAVGGNGVVRVRLTGATFARTLLLATATAPSFYHVIVKYTPPP